MASLPISQPEKVDLACATAAQRDMHDTRDTRDARDLRDTDDQASRLRAMVQSLQGPGVSLFTYAERVSPVVPSSAAVLVETPSASKPSAERDSDRTVAAARPGVERPGVERSGVERPMPGRDAPARIPAPHAAPSAPPRPAPVAQPVAQPAPAPTFAIKGPASAGAAAPARRCPVVAITSGKGGVGKTTLSVNLAIALSGLRHRTTLLDADLGLANADVLCGMSPTTRLDATIHATVHANSDPTSLESRAPRTLSTIAVPAPGGFMLVPGSVGVARMANLPVAHRRMILAGLEGLERSSDLVLIDTGAGLSDGVTTFVAAADAAIVVCTPEPTSIADAYAMIKCVVQGTRSRPDLRPRFGLIVNQTRSPAEGPSVHARLSATARKFLGIDFPLLGTLPNDDAVITSIRARSPLMLSAPHSPAALAIARTSREIARFLQLPDHEPTIAVRRGVLASLRSWIGAR